MPQWISDLISVSPVMGGIVLFIFILTVAGLAAWKWLRPPTKGLNHFLEDWNGEEARKGVDARPGMMERMAITETHQMKADTFFEKYGPIIDKLDHEMHPNSGSSMADAVNRTEVVANETAKKLNEHIAACPIPPAQTNITVTTAGAPTT